MGPRKKLVNWLKQQKAGAGSGAATTASSSAGSKHATEDTVLNVGSHLNEQLMYLTDKVKRQSAGDAKADSSNSNSNSNSNSGEQALRIIDYDSIAIRMTTLATGVFSPS